MKEIGGEFYTYDINDINNVAYEGIYTVSGRTSIDYIIKDIKATHVIEYALLPSYCCDCMIEPFITNGIKVRFYDIFMDQNNGLTFDESQLEVPEPEKNKTVVLAMDYFGFNCNLTQNIFSIIGSDAIKIEDQTHSCFSKKNEFDSDYTFSSMRKWTRFCGLSICKKNKGEFNIELPSKEWKGSDLRIKAAELKAMYINNNIGKKNVFLEYFSDAESALEEDYELYKANSYDIQVYQMLNRDKLIRQRRENASFLIDNLKSIDGVELIYKFLGSDDCPLFVPIVLSHELRDALKLYLIKRDIYCPVHWPVSEYHILNSNNSKELYECELSLPCDQRYGLNDMVRIVNEIKCFIKERDNK